MAVTLLDDVLGEADVRVFVKEEVDAVPDLDERTNGAVWMPVGGVTPK